MTRPSSWQPFGICLIPLNHQLNLHNKPIFDKNQVLEMKSFGDSLSASQQISSWNTLKNVSNNILIYKSDLIFPLFQDTKTKCLAQNKRLVKRIELLRTSNGVAFLFHSPIEVLLHFLSSETVHQHVLSSSISMMDKCKTAVSLVHLHWWYSSLALIHRYIVHIILL